MPHPANPPPCGRPAIDRADPNDIGPAIDRAFASGIPYLVNVLTDVDAAYPRATFGI